MINIDMTVPTVAPKVGGVYRDRTGMERGPMFADPNSDVYPFEDGKPRSGWTAGGRYFEGGNECRHDLIAIISEPSAEPETGVVVVKAEAFCIKAPETETLESSTYVVRFDDDGDITLRDPEAAETIQMSPAAAIAIAHAVLRMAGEEE